MRKLNKTFSSLFKNFKMFEAIKLILGNIHCLFFWGVEVNKIQDIIILSKKFHDTTTLSGNVFSYNYTKIFGNYFNEIPPPIFWWLYVHV